MNDWKPLPVSEDISRVWHEGPQSLKSRPEIAQRMAMVFSSWAAIEYRFTEILAYLVEAEEWLAAELMASIRDWKARRAIVKRAIELRWPTERVRSALDALNPERLNELFYERNNLAHGFFRVPDSMPDGIARIEGYGKNRQYFLDTVAQLDRMINVFDECASRIEMLWLEAIQYNSAKQHAAAMTSDPEYRRSFEEGQRQIRENIRRFTVDQQRGDLPDLGEPRQ